MNLITNYLSAGLQQAPRALVLVLPFQANQSFINPIAVSFNLYLCDWIDISLWVLPAVN